jgi:hypothetical protein
MPLYKVAIIKDDVIIYPGYWDEYPYITVYSITEQHSTCSIGWLIEQIGKDTKNHEILAETPYTQDQYPIEITSVEELVNLYQDYTKKLKD